MDWEHLDPMIVATMRHSGPHDPRFTDSAWERLILWASPRRLLGRNLHVNGVGLLWDDPRAVPPEARRYDVGIPIDTQDIPLVEPPAAVLVTMPGEYRKVRHHGAYDKLPQTYADALGMTLQVNELHLLAAPILELYRNSPADTPTDELITDLYVPVAHLGNG